MLKVSRIGCFLRFYEASSATIMANSLDSNDSLMNPKSSSPKNNFPRKQKVPNSPSCLKIPSCEGSRSAAIDVFILIAVIAACGFLLFPALKCVSLKMIEFIEPAFYMFKEEIMRTPMIYASIGLGFSCAAIATWILLLCTTRKCRNPNCKGLRKAAEFDIQLETEECIKNSNTLVKDASKRGLFELPPDHHKELEAELKKMAPINGRAVLLFQARCGCPVGRLEVPGPKKQRKNKKYSSLALRIQCLVVLEYVKSRKWHIWHSLTVFQSRDMEMLPPKPGNLLRLSTLFSTLATGGSKPGPALVSKASKEALLRIKVIESGKHCSICLEEFEVDGEAREMPLETGGIDEWSEKFRRWGD
ncbi:hypothetical protein V6N11_057138 [Hibiscus sabdariffa]|uniref:Uncharacterized protein n=1 Tax=Hibiscus sabdariffa TaxID=183260 RepID=A0ABR1ZRW0_9ROSI